MRLKLTLARSSGSTEDIVVTTDAAATIAEVAATIARVDPASPFQPDGNPGAGAPAAAPASPLSNDALPDLTLQAALPGHSEWLTLPPDAPVGEAWIGSGATVALTEAGRYFSPAKTGNAPTLATLEILTGSEKGRTLSLSEGSVTIGREDVCDIVLDDRMVSKKHVRLEVGDGVDVIDLGSANGVEVDGGIVTRLHVRDVDTILLGETELRIRVHESVAGAGAPKAGPIFFNRSPRVERRYAGQEFAAPEVPAEKENQPFPLLAMLTPMLLGGAMFLITKNPISLLFVAMTPMMLIGNFLTTRTRDKRRLKKAIAQFDTHLEDLDERLQREAITEREVRLAEAPSTGEALEQAMRRGPALWTRRPEHWAFLNVRLGVGSMRSRNTIKTSERGDLLPKFQERLDALIEKTAFVPGVPLIDNLYDSGALGVAGKGAAAAGALNSILVQLTALHSPGEMAVAALVSPAWSERLTWLKWMPHTSSPQSPIEGIHLADGASSAAALLSELEGLVQQRSADKRKAAKRGALRVDRAAIERGADVGEGQDVGVDAPLPAVVVIISDDVSVDRARLVQLAEQAADVGIYPIWVANDVPALPAVCRTYLSLPNGDENAVVGLVRLGETIDDAVTELIDETVALDYAKRLASVIDAGAIAADSSDLPRSVSMVSLLGHELVEQSDAVIDRWRQNNSIHDRRPGVEPKKRRAGKLRATVGSAGVEAMHLDLRTQGPHALVGGTTGAGKSEFLQAWVLGMAAEYSPDRVTFLFVDYKGGSAFADCVTLPHCVGLVTDLSPHLVRRALTSLRAELHFREHLLNRKKAKDLLELEKRGDPDSPPALVLVIDEFAALVGEVPEFVDGVVDIAQRGRSLGIHLIMATQRPAGVIKDNLRANTNLRVALRMADESDSQDVVGVKDAAHFDPAIPGRGLAKTGPGRLRTFQSGYAGGWTAREPERPGIDVSELRFGAENRWEEARRTDVDENRDLGPTDQQRLVTSIIQASSSAAIPAPRRPWLDELAKVYDLGKLRQRSDAELLLGVTDLPDTQQQKPAYFRPDLDGHLVVYGTGGSGKSTVLRTIATAAAITPRGGPVEVYGLDFGAGSLRMLETLPHVGSIINGDDNERVVRLMRYLKQQLESRAPRFAEANAASIVDYRRLANKPEEPRILLLIDGFPAFRADYEVPSGRTQWYGVFQDIIADGRQLGIHVAFTADRPGSVPGSVSSSVQGRVVLRLADDGGYGLLDVPNDILSAASPAGRAIVEGEETQIAVLGGTPVLAEQSQATAALAAAMTRAGVAAVPPVRSLPREYPVDDLPATVNGLPVVGIGDENLGPVGLEAAGTFLVSGPPASGRSNALRALAATLRRASDETRLYYVGNKRSPLASDPAFVATATTIEQAAELAKDLSAAMSDEDTEGRIVVIIEQLGDFLQTAADNPLVDMIRTAKRSDHLVIGEAESSSWTSSWPLLGEFKNARRGLLLQPETMDGEVIVKTSLPRMTRAEFPEGRGVMVASGKFQRVQMPLA